MSVTAPSTSGDQTTAAARALLEVRDLQGGYGQIIAVRGASLIVRSGEVVVVLGPNGAGKTTLLSTIAGLVPALGGTVLLAGADINKLRAHERNRAGLALVQENKRVFRSLSVVDNLIVAAPRLGKPEFDRRLSQIYSMFPVLAEKAGLPAGALSGGQQQMLAIGQALIIEPKVLLLDEPSAGLAPNLVHELMDQVCTIASTGVGVLLVEQAVHQALRIASRVFLLRLGECREQPDFRSRNAREVLEQLYLGSSSASPRSSSTTRRV
jgi:branched-chain amino acid transport system ATP-binding protein